MSILYPRTVSVRRQNIPSAATGGTVGYGGADPANEKVILSNLPAQIDYERIGRGDPANLPSDSRRGNFVIYIPTTYAPLGSITENDIIVDDLGKRYQVFAADWQQLSYQLHVELLIV